MVLIRVSYQLKLTKHILFRSYSLKIEVRDVGIRSFGVPAVQAILLCTTVLKIIPEYMTGFSIYSIIFIVIVLVIYYIAWIGL